MRQCIFTEVMLEVHLLMFVDWRCAILPCTIIVSSTLYERLSCIVDVTCSHNVERTTTRMIHENVSHRQSKNTTRSCTSKTAPMKFCYTVLLWFETSTPFRPFFMFHCTLWYPYLISATCNSRICSVIFYLRLRVVV
jgi:hypothetical protein